MSYLIGENLARRYRVDAYLGEGGMAQVYKAWDSERAAPVALKMLRADLAQDPAFLRRFRREAVMLERLQHPNIVRTYGFEQDDLLAFIVMDYISGSNLRTEIFRRQGKPLAMERILDILRPTCAALHYAHRNGIAHCDVKPANILSEESGRILLSDFGVARSTENATAMTAVSLGTPAYMAPEQIRGEDATPATDIYSVGVVLYEMLSGGERPFTGERARTTGGTAEKVRWEHLHLDPQPLRRLNPEMPASAESVVAKCLEKEAHRRYASPLDLLQDLEAVRPNAGRARFALRRAKNPPKELAEAVTLNSKPAEPRFEPVATLPHPSPVHPAPKRLRTPSWFSTLAALGLLGWHYLSAFFGKS
jgi:eukaryotic-like serine/threonine-protein kinase